MQGPYVLLVDDDDATRETVAAMLEDSFQVLDVADAAHAFSALERAPRPELVITDAHLHPGAQGVDVAHMAARLGVAVLVITGDVLLAERLEEDGQSVLRKPFGLATLIQQARDGVERTRANRARPAADLLRETCHQLADAAGRPTKRGAA